MNGDIYKADLENRFTEAAGYTITESTRGALTSLSIVNGVTDKSEKASRDAAIWAVRLNLVGGTDILARITTTQRNNANGLVEGQLIDNTTDDAIQMYKGDGVWR